LNDNEKQVKLVIDGVTGVGKSSLAKIVSDELGLVLFEEIFIDENNLLQKFFRQRQKWAFPMQVNFLNNRFRQFKEASSIRDVVMDRSIFSDHIFARMYLELDYLMPEEYDVYRGLLQNMLEHVAPPALMVFLKVEAAEAVRRIHKRGRPDELQVEESYWRRLNEFYNEHYSSYNSGNLLAIEVSEMDFVNRGRDRDELLNRIHHSLKAYCRDYQPSRQDSGKAF